MNPIDITPWVLKIEAAFPQHGKEWARLALQKAIDNTDIDVVEPDVFEYLPGQLYADFLDELLAAHFGIAPIRPASQ